VSVALVAGGGGYFGTAMVQRLLECGYTVRILDLVTPDDLPAGVEMHAGDIRDGRAVAAAVDGCEIVFNDVAQVPLSRHVPTIRSVNVDGTRRLLRAAARAGVTKVVHTSSSAVFGVPAANPVLPSTPPAPVEAYGRAKLDAEAECVAAIGRGLDVTIVRPRTILGHGRLGIFGILFEWVADGADVFVLGDGGNRYQFVHADDLAEACRLAGERPGPEVFNVGTDRFGTMRETLEGLCAHAGSGSRVRRLPAAPAAALMQAGSALHLLPFAPYHWTMYGKSLWFDIDHVRTALGWEPRWSNEDMVAQSYDWFVAHRADPPLPGRSRHRTAARQGVLRVLKSATRLLPR
jgi:nucleoside-diphosphate-sugar epimerase